MKKFHKLLKGVRQFSPFLQMIEIGISPEEIKESIIETLEPSFRNRDVLLERAVHLIPEAVVLARMENDPWALDMYQRCLDVHRSAQVAVGEESLRICVLWERAVLRGLCEYWSALHLEVPKDDLPLEEFKYEMFRNIGMLIEAPMQPHLRELLQQVRLGARMSDPGAGLDTMSLGQVVDELSKTSGFPELFAPPPWGVRLNQWRNIAQHHTSRVDGSTIVCWYGRKPGIKELRLSRLQLWAASQTLLNVFNAMKLARIIFLADNIQAARKFLPDIDYPPEDVILAFASQAASQGFEVIDVKLTDEEAIAILRDVSDLDPNERRFHASQFVYVLWFHTNRPCVKVEYREKDGTRSLLTTAWAEDCKRIARGEMEFRELPNLTSMVDLKTRVQHPRGNNAERALPDSN